jgi:hypothetical protein
LLSWQFTFNFQLTIPRDWPDNVTRHKRTGQRRENHNGLCTNSWQKLFFSAKFILQLPTPSIASIIPSLAAIVSLLNRATMASMQEKNLEFAIQPQAAAPAIDASEWPLLLKDYDKREYAMMETQADV